MSIRLRIDLPPQPYRPARVTRRGTFPDKHYGAWKKAAVEQLSEQVKGLTLSGLDRPLRVALVSVVHRPKHLRRKKDPAARIPCTTRPDADNYLKAVLDAISATGLWVDDARVVDCRTVKVYAAKDGEEPHQIVIVDLCHEVPSWAQMKSFT